MWYVGGVGLLVEVDDGGYLVEEDDGGCLVEKESDSGGGSGKVM